MSPLGESLVGAAVDTGQGMLGTWFARKQQEKLMHAQSEEYFNNVERAGATPAAIAAGVAGSAPSTVPSVSSLSGNSNIGANLASSRNSQTNENVGNSNIDINNMRLFFEPKKYQTDFMKTFAEVERMDFQNKADKALAEQLHEAAESLRLKRPWEISSISKGLEKLSAEIGLIKTQTKTTEKQGQLYDKQGNYFDASSENMYADTMNKNFEAFQHQYYNSLIALGINPTQKPWENIVQTAMYAPAKAQRLLNSITTTLNRIDAQFQDGLGKHYKRNAALGLLAYKYLNGRQDRMNNASMRFHNYASGIASFIPLAGGAPGISIANPGFTTNW